MFALVWCWFIVFFSVFFLEIFQEMIALMLVLDLSCLFSAEGNFLSMYIKKVATISWKSKPTFIANIAFTINLEAEVRK